MLQCNLTSSFYRYFFITMAALWVSASTPMAQETSKKKGPPPSPVQVAMVEKRMVSNQILLVGTTEAIAKSTVASEVSGVVEYFPVKEGDFVKKGALLVNLKETELKLRLKGAIAAREKIRADLNNAEKELARLSKLKEANSIEEKKFDEALKFADSNDIDDLIDIGILKVKKKEFNVALKIIERVIKLNPNYGIAWLNKGAVLGNLGRYDEAINSYNQALKINPNHDTAWSDKGVALGYLGKYDEAINSLD